jgi:hypothetical protein
MTRKSFKSALFTLALITVAHEAAASDVSSYSVLKGHLYTQNSSAAPTEAQFIPWIFKAAVYGDVSVITDVQMTSPQNFLSFDSSSGTGYIATFPAASLDNLNTFFPATTYTLTIDSENDGFSPVQLTLPAPAFPTAIPHISNYDPAQNINPDSDFTLTWVAFTGATGNDHVEIEIDDGGFPVFTQSVTGNSVTIPAGTLFPDMSYDAIIRFVRVSQNDTTSYPGATGSAGFYNETTFSISTASGDPGNDTTPPTLFFTFPSDQTTNSSGNTIVNFSFSEAMADTHSIKWSTNIDPARFSYFWASENSTLVCMYQGGFPADSTITWELNPTVNDPNNFKDVAGNPLASVVYKGSFFTGEGGGGSVDPCDGGGDTSAGFYSLSKTIHYYQTNNSAPIFDSTNQAAFFAGFRSPTNFTTSAVTLTGPGNLNQNLPNSFGFFFFQDSVANESTLNTAYPSGNYTFTANTSAGTKSGTLNLGTTTTVPIPQITNFEELKTMNISNDFTLKFAAFTGANSTGDGIFISISDDSGTTFIAPDPCHDITLPVTATSIVIPAGTFKSGKSYDGSITFSHGLSFDTNSIVNTPGSASVAKTTLFGFAPGQVVVPAPTWNKPTRNTDGTLNLVLTGQNGASVVIESSATLKNDWAPISTNIFSNGQVTFTVPATAKPGKFYRARMQ